MKTNIEYSDPYRFLVSAGIVLIGLGMLLPWLLLQVSLDIVISTVDLAQLTPAAQAIVNRRQTSALWLMENVGAVAGVFTGLGIFCLLFGLLFWYRRFRQQEALEILEARGKTLNAQRLLPNRFQNELDVIRRELAIEPLAVNSSRPQAQTNEANVHILTTWWDMVINGAYDSLVKKFGNTHRVDPSFQLGEEKYILLRAYQPINSDVLIKLKPVLGPRESKWFGDVIAQSLFSQQFLKKEGNRSITLHVLFVPFDDSVPLSLQDKESINKQIAPLVAKQTWGYVPSQNLITQGPGGYRWADSLFEDKPPVNPLGQRARTAAIQNRPILVIIGVSVVISVALLVGLYYLLKWLLPTFSILTHWLIALVVFSLLIAVSILLYRRNTRYYGELIIQDMRRFRFQPPEVFLLRGPKGWLPNQRLREFGIKKIYYHVEQNRSVVIGIKHEDNSLDFTIRLAPSMVEPITPDFEVVYLPNPEITGSSNDFSDDDQF